MSPQIVRIVLYVKDIPKVAAFYQKHFGLIPLPSKLPGWLELAASDGGCSIGLHQAAKSQKSGAAMKLVFGVANVRKFKAGCESEGLKFGPIHQAGIYEFANAKDPAGNSISIAGRSVL